MKLAVTFLLATFSSVVLGAATSLSTSTMALVRKRLKENSADTWVSGTQIQAILEYDYPALSVFSPVVFRSARYRFTPTETNTIADGWWSQRPSGATQFAIVSGGAAGDPASLGVGFMVAQQTESNAATQSAYQEAIEQEVNYLLKSVPRTSDGAISMRPPSESVQLWSDFMYMVPPFLAFYGATNNDTATLQAAVDQCSLYRKYLRDSSTGLWKHIELGSFQDNGLWGTGNAWAAAGITRVLATILHSSYAESFAEQIADLTNWSNEILSATFAHVLSSGLLPNYYGSSSTFADAASSALLAATAFRMDFLGVADDPDRIAIAQKIRLAVLSGIDTSTGWVTPVVDPLTWTQQTSQSPESEAFVILMEAAYRDWASSGL